MCGEIADRGIILAFAPLMQHHGRTSILTIPNHALVSRRIYLSHRDELLVSRHV